MASGPAADPREEGSNLAWSHDHTRLHQRLGRRHKGDADPFVPVVLLVREGPPAGAAAYRPVADREPERRGGPVADGADEDVRRLGPDRGPPGAGRLRAAG